MSIPLTIINRIVQGLRTKLSLTSVQCYPILQRTYVQGMGARAIQVVPEDTRTSGSGDGGQGGGMLERKQTYTLWVWYRFKGDPKDMSEDMLTAQTQGFMDYLESVRAVFTYTFLGYQTQGNQSSGSLLAEPVYYLGETRTQWHDQDKGLAYRGIMFSTTYAEVWPTTPSLQDSDFTS